MVKNKHFRIKFILIIILFLLLIASFFFFKDIKLTNSSNIEPNYLDPFNLTNNPLKEKSFNTLSNQLIKLNSKLGSYFCFETNPSIHEIKISQFTNYTFLINNTKINYLGPDITINHNTPPHQYVCYNSINPLDGISCWNNIINPIIQSTDCSSLID